MDKYITIKEKLVEYASVDTEIKAVIAFGSSTREISKADEYSDLDLMIVTENPEKWYSGEYPSLLGNVSISFIEPTLGGGKERRCIYEEDLDVDMIIFTPEQFEKALHDGVAAWVLNRGYRILYGAGEYEDSMRQYVHPEHSNPELSKTEFDNMVNDFYFHNIWASKKLLRGEVWSAKMCVDAYLKNYLLKMIELHRSMITGVDVWHDGRFLDRWAGDEILLDLKKCFAHYDRDDIISALQSTNALFSKLAREVAAKKGYAYPANAEVCANQYIKKHFNS